MNLERVDGRDDGQGNGSKRKKRKQNAKIGGRIASGRDCRLHRNVGHKLRETFEEILAAIGPVITKTADRKLS